MGLFRPWVLDWCSEIVAFSTRRLTTLAVCVIPPNNSPKGGTFKVQTAMKLTKAIRLLALTCTAFSVAGCASSSAAPTNDHAKVVQALMTLLTANNTKICVDGATHGAPLAIFRAMMTAPEAARRPLAWHVPTPLRPPAPLTGRQIFNDTFAADRALLAPPVANGDRLPVLKQVQFNTAAQSLLISGDIESTSIQNSPTTPAIHARWWALNRVWPDCTSIYTVSHPVVGGKIAFVSVTASHWGATYAFEQDRGVWLPTGQWTNWLY